MEVVWDCIGFVSAVAAVVCFPMSNCSKFLLGESRSWDFWKATIYLICSLVIVLFVLWAREFRQLRLVKCLIEKWRHLNPRFRLAASFISMIGSTLYSCIIDESSGKEKPDTVSVIFVVVAAVASMCTARHITLLEDLIFCFLGLVIAFMYRINEWHGVVIGVIISFVIILVYCCIGDPHHGS